VVVDVGNSRIKWGRSGADGIVMASLPPDDPGAWQAQAVAWGLTSPCHWMLAGVHPARRDALASWLRGQGHAVGIIASYQDVPIKIALDHPEGVGLDRLLNAAASNTRRGPDEAAIIVDAGSAVTVDWVDPTGAFCGGAIFPGLRLMALALHDYTAQLPVVEVRQPVEPPGTSTVAAIEVGILHAWAGGVEKLVAKLRGREKSRVYLTGGDAGLLAKAVTFEGQLWPEMTLHGIRLAGRREAR
jgi:type III pantothenate kinase